MKSQPDICVLTGDLIDSVNLSNAELGNAIELIEQSIRDIAGETTLNFSRSRGDGWQAAFDLSASPIRVALGITAALSADKTPLATRTSIAKGKGNSIPSDLNTATGPVFIASGRGLDALSGEQRIAYANDNAMNAIARLADAISQSWTPTQARTALHLLHPAAPTRAEVATKLGVSRQAVDKSAHGAQLPAILDALKMIETAG